MFHVRAIHNYSNWTEITGFLKKTTAPIFRHSPPSDSTSGSVLKCWPLRLLLKSEMMHLSFVKCNSASWKILTSHSTIHLLYTSQEQQAVLVSSVGKLYGSTHFYARECLPVQPPRGKIRPFRFSVDHSSMDVSCIKQNDCLQNWLRWL